MTMAYLPEYEQDETLATTPGSQHAHTHGHALEPATTPFAGRIGGNQDFVLDRSDPKNIDVLHRVPDAAPCMTLPEIFDLRGFLAPELWKFAMLECVASMLNTFLSVWVTTHPMAKSTAPTSASGVYSTITFFSPTFGGLTNLLLTPLLIYTFSPSSGGHINPLITLATLFARIISFPRAVLYILAQTLGGALAGFALHAAYGDRNITVGGCYIDTALVPVSSGLVVEFFSCLIVVWLCFGVALDPRQAKVFGPSVAPWLVGVVVGVVTWGTAWTRVGYIGASVNPARCFGAYVASEFPGYHWIHWVGPLAAAVAHGLVYFVDPLWTDPVRN
ncbi:MIP transporter [Aspergillus homomorphus CBS 101889]|uniref:MIP transporter n=1 Tax=Aspergillus homomorphus (strain CBS 101889) TaxID=1450537 RepID=A0A395HR33_ASPHC|nr:MIP transporter [Aspergillus homomorphus CBS 101889]RAL08714.1 MIP transporter [Aspergillus homomorphus CBS 101889]